MKTCNNCLLNKPLNEFYKRKASPDGLAYSCKVCNKASAIKSDKKNRARANARKRAWAKQNPEAAAETNFRWKVNNLEKYIAYQKPRRAYWSATRRARRTQRTPAWANLKAIREFYLNCPDGYHVDHIIPLNGKNVSGLHVIENLQYLPANENMRKSNKFIITIGK